MHLVWLIWFLTSVMSFTALEAYSIVKNLPTLSQSVYDLNQAWPLTSSVLGMVVGGLAVHFWWHWNPK